MTDLNLIIIRPDAELLAAAQRVIGADLVVNAYVTTWDSGRSDCEERLHIAAFKDNGADRLDYDADGCIVLEFVNRRRVVFATSEFGSIGPLGAHRQA